MARYKPIDMSPKLITVDFTRQILPGSFEYALCYLIDHEVDLSEFDHRFRNDEGGAPAHAPAPAPAPAPPSVGPETSDLPAANRPVGAHRDPQDDTGRSPWARPLDDGPDGTIR